MAVASGQKRPDAAGASVASIRDVPKINYSLDEPLLLLIKPWP
jgi:hypothetical protein